MLGGKIVSTHAQLRFFFLFMCLWYFLNCWVPVTSVAGPWVFWSPLKQNPAFQDQWTAACPQSMSWTIFFFIYLLNINALTNYRLRLWLTKLLVIESSIYPKVVVLPTWILLSFLFCFGFFLPHYFHSSFQRSCYIQPVKGISLLKRVVSHQYVTDLFIIYWRIQALVWFLQCFQDFLPPIKCWFINWLVFFFSVDSLVAAGPWCLLLEASKWNFMILRNSS